MSDHAMQLARCTAAIAGAVANGGSYDALLEQFAALYRADRPHCSDGAALPAPPQEQEPVSDEELARAAARPGDHPLRGRKCARCNLPLGYIGRDGTCCDCGQPAEAPPDAPAAVLHEARRCRCGILPYMTLSGDEVFIGCNPCGVEYTCPNILEAIETWNALGPPAPPAEAPPEPPRGTTYQLAPGELSGGPPYPTPGVAPPEERGKHREEESRPDHRHLYAGSPAPSAAELLRWVVIRDSEARRVGWFARREDAQEVQLALDLAAALRGTFGLPPVERDLDGPELLRRVRGALAAALNGEADGGNDLLAGDCIMEMRRHLAEVGIEATFADDAAAQAAAEIKRLRAELAAAQQQEATPAAAHVVTKEREGGGRDEAPHSYLCGPRRATREEALADLARWEALEGQQEGEPVAWRYTAADAPAPCNWHLTDRPDMARQYEDQGLRVEPLVVPGAPPPAAPQEAESRRVECAGGCGTALLIDKWTCENCLPPAAPSDESELVAYRGFQVFPEVPGGGPPGAGESGYWVAVAGKPGAHFTAATRPEVLALVDEWHSTILGRSDELRKAAEAIWEQVEHVSGGRGGGEYCTGCGAQPLGFEATIRHNEGCPWPRLRAALDAAPPHELTVVDMSGDDDPNGFVVTQWSNGSAEVHGPILPTGEGEGERKLWASCPEPATANAVASALAAWGREAAAPIAAPPAETVGALTFAAFRQANVTRCEQSFHPCAEWSATDWMTCVAGEVGEAANLIKKVRRGEDVPMAEIGKEIADAATYLDLLAHRLGLADLGILCAEKFNEVSKRVGSAIRLPRSAAAPPPAMSEEVRELVVAAEFFRMMPGPEGMRLDEALAALDRAGQQGGEVQRG